MTLVHDLKKYSKSSLCSDSSLCDQFNQLLTKPNCFLRKNVDAHFTASAFVFDPLAKKALLIEHRKLKKWLQPGGHADGQFDLLAVARKEIEEETGLSGLDCDGLIFDLDRHFIPEFKEVKQHEHYDVRYLFTGSSHTLKPRGNHELTDIRWFMADEIKTLNTDASVVSMFEKAMRLYE